VAEGRRREFARFPAFADPVVRARIPDPQAETTRARSVLDWARLADPEHQAWLAFHRSLLRLRAAAIMPLLAGEPVPAASWKALGDHALEVAWVFPAGTLRLVANLGPVPVAHPGPGLEWGRRLHALLLPEGGWRELPPWSAAFYLAESAR
jgi:1,4-alpha-glucan branching enzyme